MIYLLTYLLQMHLQADCLSLAPIAKTTRLRFSRGARAMLKALCAAGLALVAALSVPRSPPSATVASSTEVFSWLAARGGLLRVAVGADPNGVRGLVATEAAAIGTVLLQVPLNATLADHGDGGGASLPGEPPEWCAALPWNVQLALCVLQQRADGDSPWAAFLRSWPDEPPPLPKNLDSSQLAEAQDELFEAEADSDYFWLGLGLGLVRVRVRVS
jgi:hypothetical protein